MKKLIDKEISDYFIFSRDEIKPHAIYITRKGEAKFFLDPISLDYSDGFDEETMSNLHEIVSMYKENLFKAFVQHKRKS